MPSDLDILEAYKPTGNASIVTYVDTGDASMDVYDAGGAHNKRQERNYASHSMDVVVFAANVVGYDYHLSDDYDEDDMTESLRRWKDMLESKR